MDERSYGAKLLRRGIRKPGLLGVGHQSPREVIDIEFAEMLSVQPHGLGIEGILVGELDGCVAAVDAVEREQLDKLVARHLLAVILRRPPEQGKEVHERMWQETSVTICGNANHWAMDTF